MCFFVFCTLFFFIVYLLFVVGGLPVGLTGFNWYQMVQFSQWVSTGSNWYTHYQLALFQRWNKILINGSQREAIGTHTSWPYWFQLVSIGPVWSMGLNGKQLVIIPVGLTGFNWYQMVQFGQWVSTGSKW